MHAEGFFVAYIHIYMSIVRYISIDVCTLMYLTILRVCRLLCVGCYDDFCLLVLSPDLICLMMKSVEAVSAEVEIQTSMKRKEGGLWSLVPRLKLLLRSIYGRTRCDAFALSP